MFPLSYGQRIVWEISEVKKRRSKYARQAVRNWLKQLSFYRSQAALEVETQYYRSYSRAAAAMARLHVRWAQGDRGAQLRSLWRVGEDTIKHFAYRTRPPVTHHTRITGLHRVKPLAWLHRPTVYHRAAGQRGIFRTLRIVLNHAREEPVPQHSAQWLRLALAVRCMARGNAGRACHWSNAAKGFSARDRGRQFVRAVPPKPSRRSEASLKRRAHV